MTAAIGVILDKANNTQKFFGGGECENSSKQVSSTKKSHNNDIMCMKVNQCGGRTHAVTGQVGKYPAVFVWDTCTADVHCRVALAKNSRGVSACAISKDAKFIACADEHNDHNVRIFDVSNGELVSMDKGGPDKIFDMCFSNADGCYDVWTAGVKHLGFWCKERNYDKKNGIFGDKDRTSFSCITADDQGCAYAGGANSGIYVWNGNSCKTIYTVHEKGFVGAITWLDGKLYSGGKDGQVIIIDTASGDVLNKMNIGLLPRAIDVHGDCMILGQSDGKIVEISLAGGPGNVLMDSHNDGEVWGLDMDAEFVYTTGDDNQVKKWSPFDRKCVETAIVNTAERKAKRNKASTLGKHP
jgi:WD40 repeat protein